MRERSLYPPVKSFLEAQGYEVKGEVNGCDLVAIRGEEAPVIVELIVVKLPPARRSGSVAGVTGACVCDGSGVK